VYKVVVKRLDGSSVSANFTFDGTTPEPGEFIQVKCGRDLVNACVDFVYQHGNVDWVTAKEVE